MVLGSWSDNREDCYGTELEGWEGLERGDSGQRGDFTVPGGTEWGGSRYHRTSQSGVQFKVQESLVSGIFHSVFSDCV